MAFSNLKRIIVFQDEEGTFECRLFDLLAMKFLRFSVSLQLK